MGKRNSDDSRVLITAKRVIDGTGRAPQEPGAVLISGGRIERVGAPLDDAGALTHLDFPQSTILPGLIDCNVHLTESGRPDPSTEVQDAAVRVLMIAAHARQTLAAGITTVRDCGSHSHLEFGFRRAVAMELAISPRLVLCGQLVAATCATVATWPGLYRVADGPWEVAKAVREQVRAGADAVKLQVTGGLTGPAHESAADVQLSDEELRAGIQTAHKLGRRVACHALGVAGIRAAVAAGADTIEHGIHLHEDLQLLDTMASGRIYLVATLKLTACLCDETRPGVPPAVLQKAKRAKAHHVESVRAAMRHGVPIAMGTDCGSAWNHHGENAMELALMVAAGMTPMQAIVASTATAADALGLSDLVGRLEPGKCADLVVTPGNPLDDIATLMRPPEAVFLDGKRLVF